MDTDKKEIERKIGEAESKIRRVRSQAKTIAFLSLAAISLGLALVLFGELLFRRVKTLAVEGTLFYGITLLVTGLCFLGLSTIFKQSRVASLRRELDILMTKRRLLK